MTDEREQPAAPEPATTPKQPPATPEQPPAIPEQLPVLPLQQTVIFPWAVVPLAVTLPPFIQLVDDAMRKDRLLAMVLKRAEAAEETGPEGLYPVGVAGIIHQLSRGQDGSLRILVQGLERVRFLEFTQTEPYLVARIQPIPCREEPSTEGEALQRAAVELFQRLVRVSAELPNEIAAAAGTLAEPRQVADLIAFIAPMDAPKRQGLLELDTVDEKFRRLVDLLQRELAVRELGNKITEDTQERLSKSQRDYFLREQLRSIQRELGEDQEGRAADELRQRLEAAKLPEEAHREAERELKRLASIPEASPEHGIIRTYLEWMADLPWTTLTGSPIDIPRTRQVLDEDHYDLEKVKDRLLEYLAAKKLRQERAAQDPAPEPAERGERAHEPILCFVGPPGVGKTSLGQSIARGLGRKFIRMSLGGMRDEAEIRGHRRTYIGAMPGKIIQGLRRVEARDPLFMLDEIDKVGSDWRGDPSSALLEVLDPAQNHTYMDNYLGVAFDLSQVLFIATANTLESVPPPLRDRMEVLDLSGYTDEEKVRIAEQYLIPKQQKAHGLTREELCIDPEALRQIIRGYTREAGVRNLDREIAAVARKMARRAAEGAGEAAPVTTERVAELLGRPRFFDEVAERTTRPGVATGLAWTPSGGDVLFVEATAMPGKGEELLLTGMLGDVMRESAQAALSYIRSQAAPLGLPTDFFEGKRVHIHVPAGAIPKDGPSAGITIATALASLAAGRVVQSDVAMTGEITLRGKVLPVGGIKEKALAAHRIGIRRLFLPRRNERDLEDVPEEARQALTVTLVDSAEEVLAAALAPTGA